MIKLVDRYIGRAALLGMLLVWLAMTVLFMVFTLLGELRSTQNDYGTLDVLWFVALTLPRMAYQVFPVSALLGALVGVGGLAASNELVAFRTAGISRLRLAVAALTGTLLLTVPVIIMGEWVAPAAEQQARAYRLSEQVGQAIIGGVRGVWMRDGPEIVNIQRPLLYADRGGQTVEFKDVVIYQFSGQARLLSITRAGSAAHAGGYWTLEDVSRIEFGEDGAVQIRLDQQAWSTEVRPELLDSAVTRPKLLSMRSLWEYLDYLGENGLDDEVYQAAFWEKALFPFTVLALVLAGMPFVFGQARWHSVGVRLFFGMTLGGLFMIVSRALQKLGGVYDVPPPITIAVPVLLLAVGAVVVLRRTV
ncbi:MAG: LPS export ABC transporter permease LptG [Xanthomonadales bacterium]|nr:LPS export ABC transporter permease LptG [Xanthomonadales bacterium]